MVFCKILVVLFLAITGASWSQAMQAELPQKNAQQPVTPVGTARNTINAPVTEDPGSGVGEIMRRTLIEGMISSILNSNSNTGESYLFNPNADEKTAFETNLNVLASKIREIIRELRGISDAEKVRCNAVLETILNEMKLEYLNKAQSTQKIK